ncbi:AMSH-like protease sst2 [Ceratocystis platani]|uniref:AMSH-like protease sst2 n=1 Tax=Ceratocystis fimbriata f. sp. platani TaxID=88771 RepID=A0A0F8B343_CERFI|nr:AMSH-like protease sst2 [Ceratocystis platani]
MDALQAKLQALSDDFQKLQQDLQEKVAARQKLDSQKQENLTVQAEFERLKDGDVIYKTVGPVLLKQEKFEAENTVSGRLDFISGEISRVEVQIKEIQDKMETKKTEIIQVQSKMDRLQMRHGQPLSVKEITRASEDFNFNTNLQFKYWVRSTKALYQEAVFAARENDFRRAYFYLYRHSILVLQILPSHPEFKDVESKKLYRPLTKALPTVLKLMEEFKPRIEEEYNEWQRMQPNEQLQSPQKPPTQREMFREILDPNARKNVRVIDATENLELAMRVGRAVQEKRDNESARPVERYGGDGMRWPGPSQTRLFEPPSQEQQKADDDVFQQQMQAARRNLDFSRLDAPAPSLSVRSPQRPPKDLPVPEPKINEPEFVFAPGAYLESGEPLRPMFLPSGLRKAFVALARVNTSRHIETCGMLCGAPQNGALYIHELLVPEQVGTSDTCETVNELAIYEHLEKHNLVCYGWIHTHPTQTCFMSSRDLHTHASYQAGLPEAIAIVCAPTSEPSYGIFRLTDPSGKDHILDCRQTATFHPHSIDNIYTKCNKPIGHVIEREDLTFTVVDLR